jgi:hypothetical protein
MKEIISHIKEVKRFINTDKDMIEYSKHKLLEAFYSGKLYDVFPPPIYEDILSFVSEQLANGSDKVLIGLKTKNESAIIFKYSIQPTSSGIVLKTDDYSIGVKPYSIDFPENTSGKCLLLDVSSID